MSETKTSSASSAPSDSICFFHECHLQQVALPNFVAAGAKSADEQQQQHQQKNPKTKTNNNKKFRV